MRFSRRDASAAYNLPRDCTAYASEWVANATVFDAPVSRPSQKTGEFCPSRSTSYASRLKTAPTVCPKSMRRVCDGNHTSEACRPGAGHRGLGLGIAAVTIVPLGVYLSKSPVWADPGTRSPSPWTIEPPRFLDAVCTIVPYAFGSQRRGHPNLARALGVHNLNESAGGFAGLATAIWLAPLAWSKAKPPDRRVSLSALVTVFGLSALRLPPGRQPSCEPFPCST